MFSSQTPSWESLGGSFQGKPVGVLGTDSRLEVFVRGTDNTLWFAAQTSPGGSWTPFVSLGGVIISNPAVAVDRTGHISVFAPGTDGIVWTRSQITAGVDNYSDWTSIGGYGTSDVAVLQTFPSQHFAGDAFLLVRGGDNALWVNSSGAASGPRGQWRSLGGYLTSAPAVGLNVNNQITELVRGDDSALWYRHLTGPGVDDWASLGGVMNGPPQLGPQSAVVYQGIDGAAWFLFETTPKSTGAILPPTCWSNPVSLGAYIISNPTMTDSGNTNDLEVFAVGTDNGLWVTLSQGIGLPFGPWQSLGGYVGGDPFALRNGDGLIDVFAIGFDSARYDIRQSTAGNWQ